MPVRHALAAVLALLPLGGALAQPVDAPGVGSDPGRDAATLSGAPPGLSALLVDREKKAARQEATVEARPRNVTIIDPAATGGRPMKGQAHLHYRVDEGPVIATTVTKLSFHELAPGNHRISVVLAGNDHRPLTPPVVLDVRVP